MEDIADEVMPLVSLIVWCPTPRLRLLFSFLFPTFLPCNFQIQLEKSDRTRRASSCQSCTPPLFLPVPSAFFHRLDSDRIIGGEINPAMDAPSPSCGLFSAQISLHDLLGGGTGADVVLWRRKEAAGGLLAAAAASWALFYCVPGYTLLSFVSQVLMILLTVLFAWAKAARLLGRSPPPVPLMKISEDHMKQAAETVGVYMNKVLQDFESIALGKDSSLFYKVAFVLLMTSVVGRLTDLITLVYTSIVIGLTIPALLEKSENHIARFLKKASTYVQACKEYKSKMASRVLEKKKLC